MREFTLESEIARFESFLRRQESLHEFRALGVSGRFLPAQE